MSASPEHRGGRRIAVATAPLSHPHPDPEVAETTEALRKRGHEAETVAWDADLDSSAFDLVVVRSTWDYFDRVDQFLAWADRVGGVSRLVNPAQVLRWNAHKGYLAQLATEGLPVVPTLEVPRGGEGAGVLRECGWPQVVLKPAVDGGARYAIRTPSRTDEAQHYLERLLARGDAIVQPYVEAVEAGESSLFYFGGVLSHAVRKVPAAGDFRVQAHHGGEEHPHEPTGAEREVAEAVTARTPGPLTYARVDLVELEGRPVLIELEVIEPDLFFRLSEGGLERFADAVVAALP